MCILLYAFARLHPDIAGIQIKTRHIISVEAVSSPVKWHSLTLQFCLWYETEDDGSVLGIIVVLPFLVLLLLAFDTVMTWEGAGGRKRIRVYRSIVVWKIHGTEGLRSILSSFVWNCKPILMLATCDTWQFSHTRFFPFFLLRRYRKE